MMATRITHTDVSVWSSIFKVEEKKNNRNPVHDYIINTIIIQNIQNSTLQYVFILYCSLLHLPEFSGAKNTMIQIVGPDLVRR